MRRRGASLLALFFTSTLIAISAPSAATAAVSAPLEAKALRERTSTLPPRLDPHCFTVSAAEQVCYSGVFPPDPSFVDLGQSIPLPLTEYVNDTDREMTFTIEWAGVDFAGSGTIQNVTQAARTTQSYPDLSFAIGDAIPLGTHQVAIGWSASGGGFDATAQIPIEIVVVMPSQLREIIQLPVRWCVVQGSPQAGNKQPGETVDGARLLSLLQNVNNVVYLPEASILLRHASAPEGIPVIKDPSVGEHLGDLAISNNDEWHTGIALCAKAWADRYPEQKGTVLVNARTIIPDSFLNVGGVAPAIPFALRVQSPEPGSGQRGNDLCGHPRHLMVSDITWLDGVAVYDQAMFKAPGSRYTGDTLAPIKVLAHEIGHTLTLGHGNGLDDNNDGLQPPTAGARRFDEYCDRLEETEDNTTPPTTCEASLSLMRNSDCTNLQPLQREMAREAAKLVPGAVVTDPSADPAGQLIATLDDGCPGHCAISPSLVVWKAEVAESPDLAVTSFSHHVLELPSSNGVNRYSIDADLDNDPSTGCTDSSPGLPDFHGAELRTEVALTVSGGTTTLAPTVSRCDSGAWVEVHDPGIQATAAVSPSTSNDATTVNKYAIIGLQVPDAVRGPMGDVVRLQAASRGPSGQLNLLPPNGAGEAISLTPPQLPTCTITPPLARPGQTVAVAADGLSASQSANIFVAAVSVGSASIGANGHLDTTIVVPATSAAGVRQVEVRAHGGAVSAACALLVQGDRLTPATTASLSPAPNASEWNNSTVTVTLTAADVPGGPGIQGITYDASGAQPIPSTTQPGATTQFAMNQEGDTAIHFYATNNGGVSEAPQSVTVHLDETPPTVTYSGNNSPYGILDNVNITCAAADALSGVLLDTCQNITGPAYTFDPASNVFSASATDFAGNVGAGSTRFSLHVTYDDLCTLTTQFIHTPPLTPRQASVLGESSCSKLANAKAAQLRGNYRTKLSMIQAYIAQILANPRAVFSQAEMTILTRLARAL